MQAPLRVTVATVTPSVSDLALREGASPAIRLPLACSDMPWSLLPRALYRIHRTQPLSPVACLPAACAVLRGGRA